MGDKIMDSASVSYIVQCGGGNSSSPEYTFHPLPLPGQQVGSTPLRIAAFGDLGQGEYDGSYVKEGKSQGALESVGRILLGDYDLIWHFGDISYARGSQDQWVNYGHQMQSVASSVPYMIGLGNHERDYPAS